VTVDGRRSQNWRASTLLCPKDLPPAACDLTVVAGPPAAGKTTWANANAEHVIDLDVILQRLTGFERRGPSISFLHAALTERNDMLRALQHEVRVTAFIVTAPDGDERAHWKRMLGARQIVVCNPGERVCRNRIVADDDRVDVRRRQIAALRRWYKEFTPCDDDVSIGDGGAEYQSLYGSQAWKRRRAAHLKTEPLCRRCLAIGIVNDGTLTMQGQAQPNRRRHFLVADHIEPHLGDAYKFWNGELQTLCPDHHDKAKQVEEHRGYSTETGADGWPVDVSHPGNSAKG